MALGDVFGRGSRQAVKRDRSWLAGAVFLPLVVGIAQASGQWTALIIALSFWHYYVYALAFLFRLVPLALFKRHAVVLKTVALVAFGAVYLPAGPAPLSLVVVALGLALNIKAATALGSDRTYYGHEIAGLPPKRITAFPYSIIAHPMLLGNALAFAGTLLDPAFRQDWWPLAVAHVACNLAILAMEVRARPQACPPATARLGAWPTGAGLLAAAAMIALAGPAAPLVTYVAMASAMLGYGLVLFGVYVPPMASRHNGRALPAGEST